MSTLDLMLNAPPDTILKLKQTRARNKLKAFALGNPSLVRTPAQAAQDVRGWLLLATKQPKDSKLTDEALAKLWQDGQRSQRGMRPLDPKAQQDRTVKPLQPKVLGDKAPPPTQAPV